jgi:hypothetical protein
LQTLGHLWVAGEGEDLPGLRKLSQDFEASITARGVPVDQSLVDEEREPLVPAVEVIHDRESQTQVRLFERARRDRLSQWHRSGQARPYELKEISVAQLIDQDSILGGR